jgi:hypothetical protein
MAVDHYEQPTLWVKLEFITVQLYSMEILLAQMVYALYHLIVDQMLVVLVQMLEQVEVKQYNEF